MQTIPLVLQTSYADLLDKLLDEAVIADGTGESGSYVAKTIKGRRYWYRQYNDQAGRHQHYVGPETPDLLTRIERHKSMQDTARSRREIVRSLIGSGAVPVPAGRVGRVVQALAEAGVFRLRAVLIGTVAFGCYGPMLGIRLRSANLMTADIDIAQFRSISIAVEDRIPPVLDALRSVDAAFQPITLPLYDRPPISYGTGGVGGAADPLKVEFLTPMRGPVEDAPGTLPALQTSAQPLRFLDYLIYGERKAAYLYDSGVLVNVPHPARYAWHKCIVAVRRERSDKVRKDLAQAEALFDVLVKEHPHDVHDMFEELEGPGRVKWKEIALEGLRKIESPVRQQVLDLISPGVPASTSSPE